MTTYNVSCEASCDCDEIEANSPEEAADKYLDGYQTRDLEGVDVPEGEKYSDIEVSLFGDDDYGVRHFNCIYKRTIYADGKGGILEKHT